MKSQVSVCLRIVRGMFDDISLEYPQLAKSLDRDLRRYTLCCQTRGIGYLGLDLPMFDSLLLEGLEHGRLPSFSFARKKSSAQVPAFLQGLWLRVFDNGGLLLEQVDHTAVFFLRQIFCFGKKLVHECSPERLNKAVKEYIHDDRSLRLPTLAWGADVLDSNSARNGIHFRDIVGSHLPLFPNGTKEDDYTTTRRLNRLQRFADDFCASFCSDYPTWAEECDASQWGHGRQKHGPGAVADREYRSSKWNSPNYPRKLDLLFPFDVFCTSLEKVNHEPPSRLIAVPKTMKSPRLIASEPVWNQNLQQNLLGYFMFITKKFPEIGIDFQSQEKSRDMARLGSLHPESKEYQPLCTIDLSSASDRLSCFVVERIFRKSSILDLLHATRTRWLRANIGSFDESFLKRKFASQGSATTFPVQSIVFAIIAYAAIAKPGDNLITTMKKNRGMVRIFGDDIIIPKSGYGAMVRLLHDLELRVNMEKSFHLGMFRESCGGDFYQGYDVTPVKPQYLASDGPATKESLFELSNNLFIKGMWRASEVARIETAISDKLPVVGLRCGVRGLTSFVGSHTKGLKARWNVGLQRLEFQFLTFSDREVGSETNEFTPSYIRHKTHRYAPVRWSDRLFDVHGVGQPRTRKRVYRLRWEGASSLATTSCLATLKV